jgi:hypothetical protein
VVVDIRSFEDIASRARTAVDEARGLVHAVRAAKHGLLDGLSQVHRVMVAHAPSGETKDVLPMRLQRRAGYLGSKKDTTYCRPATPMFRTSQQEKVFAEVVASGPEHLVSGQSNRAKQSAMREGAPA